MKFFATAFIGILMSATANASLINGDFEADVGLSGTAWNIFGSIPGWTTYSGGGIEVQHNTIVPAHSGNQYVELDSWNNSSMYQEVTGLSLGETYELSFWYHTRTNAGDNDNGIQVYWGESALGNLQLDIADLISSVSYEWINYSLNLVATTESMFLGFAASGLDNSLGGFIDSVSLEPVEVSEPASLALLFIGLLGLVIGRRRLG